MYPVCYLRLRYPSWHAGVSDLERSDPGEGQASKYALLISDTYLIEEGPPQQLTNMATRRWSDVAYFFAVRLFTAAHSASLSKSFRMVASAHVYGFSSGSRAHGS